MSEQAYTPRKCTKHVPYWETVYGNCMACRAEKAEQQLQAIQATVGETEFALRARVAELEAKLKRLQVFVDTSQWQKDNESLKQQLATATAQATFTQHRFDDAIEAIDR